MPLEQISYSGLRKADVCLRQWWALEYLGLRPINTKPVGPLAFGSRIHLAVEIWAKSHWQLDVSQIWDALMHREHVLDDENDGWNADALAKESAMGAAMLEGWKSFVEEEGIDANWEVVDIESKLSSNVEFELADGKVITVQMRSKLDLLLRHKEYGTIWVFDYKTAQSLSEASVAVAVDSEQGPMYVIQARRKMGEDIWVAGFILGILRKVKRGPTSKPPYYAWQEVPMSDDLLAAAEANITAKISRLVDIVDRLDAGEPHQSVVPYTVSWSCKDCAFRLPCAEMREGNFAGAEDMMAGEFVVGNPLERYVEDDSLQDAIVAALV